MQWLDAMQDTPFSEAPGDGGFRVCSIAQFVPFHRSANVMPLPLLVLCKPTAVHALAEAHDTLISWLNDEPWGTGVGSIVQFVPFHVSANDAYPVPVELYENPTAVHEVADLQDTPFSCVPVEPGGLIAGSSLHFAPFQDSANAN